MALLVVAPSVKRAIFQRADAEGFDGDQEKRLAAWQKATIVAFALREAGGLIGFVLTAITGNSWWAWAWERRTDRHGPGLAELKHLVV